MKKRSTIGRRFRLYLVCTVQRTGSTWLCWALKSTGVMGAPREWFGVQALQDAATPRRRGLPYLEALARRTSTPNGVFGVKVMLEDLDGSGLPDDWPRIAATFSARLVWLRRRDKLRQAISRYRAAASGQWLKREGTSTRQPPVRFDEQAIRTHQRSLVASNEAWRDVFRRFGVRPLEIWYENLLANPDRTVRRVGRHVGVRIERIDWKRCPWKIQRDAVTEEWVRRLSAGGGP